MANNDDILKMLFSGSAGDKLKQLGKVSKTASKGLGGLAGTSATALVGAEELYKLYKAIGRTNTEKATQKRLEETNIQRQLLGLPTIDVYGNVNSAPVSKSQTTNKENTQSVSTNSSNKMKSVSSAPKGGKGTGSIKDIIDVNSNIYGYGNQPQSQQVMPLEQIDTTGVETETPSGLTYDDILSLIQNQAQQRQQIYQPYQQQLQNTINNYNDMARYQERENRIRAGLAGIANNANIYRASLESNPMTREVAKADLMAKQAQLQDQLRFDPTQAQADMALAQSMGYSPLMAVASGDVVKALANLGRLDAQVKNQEAMLALKQAIEDREAKQQQWEQGFKETSLGETQRHNKAVEELQQEKANKPDAGKLIPETAVSNISSIEDANSQLNGLIAQIPKLPKELKDPIKSKLYGLNPYDKNAQTYKQYIATMKQVIGKGLEGGVLRKEDEYKYDKIIPKFGDTDAILLSKSKQLQSMLNAKKKAYITNLNKAGYNVQNFIPQSNLNINRSAIEAEMRRRGLK